VKIVMKFGGTSLADATAIKNAAAIVEQFHKGNRIAVVASAMNDTTDHLIKLGELAQKGQLWEAKNLLSRIQAAHLNATKSFAGTKTNHLASKELLGKVNALLSSLERSVEGIGQLRELTLRSRDYLLSFGERLSVPILTTALAQKGLKAQAFTGSDAGIVTDNNFGEAKPLAEISTHQIQQRLGPLLEAGGLPVVTGFIAQNTDGNTTTLGRGGSDYTASLIGAALKADEVWIWTDVDGLMTADPHVVKDAVTLSNVSFGEALELSYFGAKMMHPRALQPAARHKIPVRIRNSSKPTFEGTLVSADQSMNNGKVAKAISIIKDVGIITISGASMMGAPGVAAKILQSLGIKGVNVVMISQGSSEATISCVIARKDVDRAVRSLQLSLMGQGDVEKVTEEKDACVIAVVGSGMKGSPGVAARVFTAVAKKNVNVRMIAQGTSEYNISFVVSDVDGPETVRALHDEFQLGSKNQSS